MDTTCVVGTDIATFYLYEPEALQHRMHSASDWFYDLGSTQADLGQVTIPERLDGRLVVIDTALPLSVEHEGATRLVWCGSDGAYVFRCTTGTLTTAEVALEYPETRERLAADRIHVTHERLLLDGGYCPPPVAPRLCSTRWNDSSVPGSPCPMGGTRLPRITSTRRRTIRTKSCLPRLC
jgi:hypothetical protein